MDSENVIGPKSINLAINYIDASEVEFSFDCIKDEALKKNLLNLFQEFKDETEPDSRTETFDEIIQAIRGQLKALETVGEILDVLGFAIKMLFVETSFSTSDLLLLTDIFHIMPAPWESDPVKVHLITKIVYETLNADFNNVHYVITKILCIDSRMGFYVGLTLFWALYLNYFKKECHHYYKMYNADKFFKLLMTNEPFNDSQDTNSMFKLMLLISIYQNYVLLNKAKPESHQIFQEFFRVSHHDREKLEGWLINVKNLIEVNNPLGKSNQSADVLMLLEFLELDLISGISQDGDQQQCEQIKGDSHAGEIDE